MKRHDAERNSMYHVIFLLPELNTPGQWDELKNQKVINDSMSRIGLKHLKDQCFSKYA